jgi:cell fate regulator YaaT (PSP1 superfamily)
MVDDPPLKNRSEIYRWHVKDLEQLEKKAADERAAHPFTEVLRARLEMNLFDWKVFDGSRCTFTADGRIDFRQLLKMLVKELGVRIEMRQVGIRNQAKMCGGLGRCGREQCCSSYLVRTGVVRMAKEQSCR